MLFSILFLYGAFFTTHFCALPSVLATKYCPLSMFLFSISLLDFLFFSWKWGVFFNRLIRCSTYISEISIQQQFSTKLNSLGLRFLKFHFWTNGLRPHNSFPYGSQQLHELQNITNSVMQQIFSCKKLFFYDWVLIFEYPTRIVFSFVLLFSLTGLSAAITILFSVNIPVRKLHGGDSSFVSLNVKKKRGQLYITSKI